MKTETAPQPSAALDYDRRYREWLDGQGPRALDLDWRMRRLLWRQRVLLRRFSPDRKRVLDFGCMDGIFTLRLQQLGAEAVGYDISPAAIRQAEKFRGAAPHPVFTTVLPGPGQFDLVYCNEVLEHVRDDALTLREACRVTRPGGNVAIFCPNRLYPFETHGVFLGKRYIFGNIPLVNYLPDPLRHRFVPHVRAYTRRGLRRLLARLPARTVVHTCVWPGFDNLRARSGLASAALRRVLYPLESTPLRNFGLSHFVILERKD